MSKMQRSNLQQSKRQLTKNALRLGAVVLSSGAMLGLGAVTVGAATTGSATPDTLSGIQAKASAAITLRVNDLNGAISKVNSAKNLGSDATTLDAYLQADIAPLQQLGQKIAADTSVTTAKADFETIFSNFRVLALVLPVADLAGRSDSIDNGDIPTLTADSAQAAAKVNASNQTTLQPLITDLNNQISAASNSTSGVASTVLGYTPSQWNANNQLLASAKSSVSSAEGDVKKARSDLQQIRSYLKSNPTPAAAPTTGD